MNKKYRYERKYYLSPIEYNILKSRFCAVLQPDKYSRLQDNGYDVNNLYFDDIYHTAYHEKQAGHWRRDKFRIRHYNNDLSMLRLERKSKRGELVHKDSAILTPEQYSNLLIGNLDMLNNANHFLLDIMYRTYITRHLQPVCTVDYTRRVYIYQPGNVRVTFDTELHGGNGELKFPILPKGTVIMELKYDGFLPLIIEDLLSGVTLTQTAISKYILAMDKIKEMNLFVFRTA